jgi:hypothetical protein
MKNLTRKFYAVFAVAILALVVTAATGANFFVAGGAVTALSLLPAGETGVAFAGLNKEIWLPELMEGFYADDSFLSEMRDMSAFVDNDVINLAEAGVNPDVLVNNTAYPISTSQRTDGAIALSLDYFDTENSLIRNIETAELAYDKRASIMYGHKQALRMTFMQKAAHAIAPSADSTDTPLLTTSGADNGDGFKRLTYADILKLKKRFDNAEIPADGRILILSSQHQEDLELEDASRYNLVMDKGVLRGFKLYFLADQRLPRYNKTSGAKVAYGAAAAPSTDTICSIAFHKDEVMKAQGSLDMFLREKDPEQRGDILGFQMRGLSLPIRNKGVAAIYSAEV